MRKMKKSKKTCAQRRKQARYDFLQKLKDPDYGKPLDMEEMTQKILEEVRRSEAEHKKAKLDYEKQIIYWDYQQKCKTT